MVYRDVESTLGYGRDATCGYLLRSLTRWKCLTDVTSKTRDTEAQMEPLLSVRKVYYDSEIWKQGYTRNKGECDMPVASATDLPNRRAVEREWGPLSLGPQDAEGFLHDVWVREATTLLVPLFVTKLLMLPSSDKVWFISARNTVGTIYEQQ